MDLKNYKTDIESDRLYLRILKENDAIERYASWLNDSVVNKYLETRKATIEELKSYIKEKLESKSQLLFGIFWKENNQHIGNIKIDFERKYNNIGILIGERDYWGCGIATEVIELITNYIFNTFDLDELCLGIFLENKAAFRVYEKCGYEIFKIDKKSVKHHDGIVYDQVYMRRRKVPK